MIATLTAALVLSTGGHANVSFYTTGTRTASGKPFNTHTMMTCAVQYRSRRDKRPSLQFGTRVRLTNIKTNKSVVVVVTDTGSYRTSWGRWFDCSKKAFVALMGSTKVGRTKPGMVTYEIL